MTKSLSQSDVKINIIVQFTSDINNSNIATEYFTCLYTVNLDKQSIKVIYLSSDFPIDVQLTLAPVSLTSTLPVKITTYFLRVSRLI